jgi:hypothetical protein
LKAAPQIEPRCHKESGQSGEQRRGARLPSEAPFDGVEELCGIFGDGVDQAADFFSAATSIPSQNVTPLTTFGN